MDRFTSSEPLRRRLRRLTRGERLEEAIAFIRLYARENGIGDAERKQREREVRQALKANNHYVHSAAELSFGARVAWRNHARCIGRLTWESLHVEDCRHITAPAAVLEATLSNLANAYNAGRMRSSISIFAPATPDSLPTTFESQQIFQYAGYIEAKGAIIGDRQNIEFTRIAQSLGWSPPTPRSGFDLLPVILSDPQGNRHAYNLAPAQAHQIHISHPGFPALDLLGLRWYAIPCVSNMVLTIGGIDYPCAPFNGHYVATEIASRDLVDERRYDLLEPIARAFGLDTSGADPLWRDTAITELNRAVLHSFARAGVRMLDHHDASRQYMEFVKLEQRAGRIASGEWSWLVPPQASAACPVFHLPMTNQNDVPNFYLSRQLDGGALHVDRTRMRDGKWRQRYERLKRRWRDWRRRRDRLWHRA